MSDQRLRDLGVHIEDSTPMHDFEDLVRRARRRVAVRRAGTLASVVAITIAVVFGVAVVDRNRQTSPPPVDRTEQSRDTWCRPTTGRDCFADIHGWIVYSTLNGIRAVSPAFVDSNDQIQLTDGYEDEPLGWSSDGTKLLIRRDIAAPLVNEDYRPAVELVVLNADGTETTVARAGCCPDGSISPDGSRVVYSGGLDGDGIYTVGTDGGTPRILLAAVPRQLPGEELPEYPVGLYLPRFSPDGTQIAYFDGMGDWGHSLRVMRSDGTDVRVLIDRVDAPAHIADLEWSPDGQRLMFAGGPDEGGGIWIIGVDGSGLTKLLPDAVNPAWSPDGTRISYQTLELDEFGSTMRIADTDGTHVTKFRWGGSGPWNPLPLDH